jgi:hypothetical protein
MRTEKDVQHDDTEKRLSSIPVMQMPHGALPVPVVDSYEKIKTSAAAVPAEVPASKTRTVITHHSYDEAGKNDCRCRFIVYR